MVARVFWWLQRCLTDCCGVGMWLLGCSGSCKCVLTGGKNIMVVINLF